MTQTSRPAGTDSTTWPNSDAGPYNADQWSQIYQTLFTGDQHATQGPLIRYLNELIGTVNVVGPPAEIRVDTGAAMVNGHWFESDATVDFTLVAPGANPRIDVVVIAVNNTAVDFAVSDGGFNLDFPDNLADYGADADIEEYSCRLCIVQGAELGVPVAPGLDANNNHWMIPLYQYQINVAGAISGQTDRRDFCEFSTEVVTAMIADEAVTYAKLVHSAGLSIIGKATVGAGDPADIIAGNNTVLAKSGGAQIAFQEVETNMIENNAVDDTKLRDSAATSVIGKAGAGVGDPADIVAGVNDRVFAQAAGTLSFQQVATGMIADEAVTLAKLQHFAGFDVIGKIGAGAGDPVSIVAGANTVLAKLGAGNVAFQLIVPALVTDRTRKFFVPALGGYNDTDVADIVHNEIQGIPFPDAKDCSGFGQFMVPEDFVSDMTVTVVIIPIGTGDVYSRNRIEYSACGEASSTHSDFIPGGGGLAAVAVTATERECIQEVTLANEAIGDLMSCLYQRDGTDILDTIGATVKLLGWIVEYIADS